MKDKCDQDVTSGDLIAVSSSYGFDIGVFKVNMNSVQYYPICQSNKDVANGIANRKLYCTFIHGSYVSKRVLRITPESLPEDMRDIYHSIVKHIKGI